MGIEKTRTVIGQNLAKAIFCAPYVKAFCNNTEADLVVTIADLVAEAVADGVEFPNGNPPGGVLGWEAALKPKGGDCTLPDGTIFNSTSADATIQNAAGTTIRNLDGGGQYESNNHLIDDNCDGFADQCVDPAEQITIAPGSIVVLGASLVEKAA